jgi:hypothetical protein
MLISLAKLGGRVSASQLPAPIKARAGSRTSLHPYRVNVESFVVSRSYFPIVRNYVSWAKNVQPLRLSAST